MEIGKIKIANVICGAAYCYATEIAFHNYTDVNIEDFDATNPEHVVYLIIAAVFAYYQGTGEELPITDNDVIIKASPTEITEAVKTIVKLRVDWYKLPKGEGEEAKKEVEEGNSKN